MRGDMTLKTCREILQKQMDNKMRLNSLQIILIQISLPRILVKEQRRKENDATV